MYTYIQKSFTLNKNQNLLTVKFTKQIKLSKKVNVLVKIQLEIIFILQYEGKIRLSIKKRKRDRDIRSIKA